ncbi:MAG: type III-A CRISPR-associated protein Csm2 [Syntrophales bacterium]|nr:type III-A CRISPR-associated protein Csm2 [Syntrophales bacterium]
MSEYPNFYENREKKIVSVKLFSEEAEKWAEKIWTSRRGSNSNRRAQIRKFYDEVMRYNEIVKKNPSEWQVIHPFVNMIIAKVVYAKGRDNLVTEEFVKLIKGCIEQVKDPEDLDVFANFFEAFMGFYRQYEVKKKDDEMKADKKGGAKNGYKT